MSVCVCVCVRACVRERERERERARARERGVCGGMLQERTHTCTHNRMPVACSQLETRQRKMFHVYGTHKHANMQTHTHTHTHTHTPRCSGVFPSKPRAYQLLLLTIFNTHTHTHTPRCSGTFQVDLRHLTALLTISSCTRPCDASSRRAGNPANNSAPVCVCVCVCVCARAHE